MTDQSSIRVPRGTPAGQATQMVLSSQCQVFETLLPRARQPTEPWDPEILHDLRVAVRRSRSVMRQLRPVFPRGQWRRHRRNLRDLQQVTGPARDLDVLALRWDKLTSDLPAEHSDALRALTDRLDAQRAAALAILPELLGASALQAALAEWHEFVTAPPDRWRRPAAVQPVEDLVAPRLDQLGRQVSAPERSRPDTPDEQLHELRKEGKELRYVLELFGTTVLPESAVAAGRNLMKALQTELGRHQDAVVQRQLVLTLATDVNAAAGPDAEDPALVDLTAGLVFERLAASQTDARQRIPARLDAVAAWHRSIGS